MKFKVGDRVRFRAEHKQSAVAEHIDPDGTYTVEGVEGVYEGYLVRICSGKVFFDCRLEPAHALIQMGGEYQTRDGQKVRLLAVDLPGDEPVAAAVVREDGSLAFVSTWRSDGRYIKDEDYPDDLIPVPPKPKEYEGWVNVYMTDEVSMGQFNVTKEAAEENRTTGRIACLHLKFREGEGL